MHSGGLAIRLTHWLLLEGPDFLMRKIDHQKTNAKTKTQSEKCTYRVVN